MTKSVHKDRFVSLAQEAVEEWVRFNRVKASPEPLPLELHEKAGAFVCLKKHGELRGCIGTIAATQEHLGNEIIRNAIHAAVEDPRFEPVTADELDDLVYMVDVLGAAERIESFDQLDPKTYGVIVESGYKRGLLLPDLEGVDTVEAQVSIAMRKAGITSADPVALSRFQVIRHD
jgi:AmmeMemoRadiSam system protein A